MCLIYYIASDHPLPLKPWNENKPDFHVSELSKDIKIVRKRFDVTHVRLASSWERCGCAFNYGHEYPDDEDESDDEDEIYGLMAQRSREKLIEYLRINTVKQIYSCWAGDEGEPIENRKTIRLDDMMSDNFVFQDRELLTIIHIK
jgi:hypothetical protein